MSIGDLKLAMEKIGKKYDLMFVDRTHFASPKEYKIWSARLDAGKYDGIQISIHLNPIQITIIMGDYGYSDSTLIP